MFFDKANGLRPCAIALAVALALGLSGCGGGSNVRPSPSTPPPPGSGTGNQPPTVLTGNYTVSFDDSTKTWSQDVSGSGSLTKDGTGKLVITGTDTWTGGSEISKGTLQIGDGGASGSISGNVTDNASFVFDRSDDVTFDGIVSGSGSLTQAGKGTLTLTGANTYTGGTTISAGTLQLGNGGTTGSIEGDVADGGSLVFDRSNDMAFAGVVSGSGSVTQAGAGTLTLTGANTYSGGTTISAGVLQIGNGGTTSSITGEAVDNGSLVFNRSDDVTFAGVVSGSGSLTQAGTGTLTLTGTNSYTGDTIINGGSTLALSGRGSIADSADVTVDGTQPGMLDISGTDNGASIVSLDGNGAVKLGTMSLILTNASGTFSGVITGSGSLTLASGEEILSGANTYTGGTMISAGTLQVGNGGTSGSITGDVTDNGSLVFNRSDDMTFAGIISGKGTLTQFGAGTLTLTGASTYAGGTVVSGAGILEIASAGKPGSSTVTLNYGTLQIDSGVQFSNPIALGWHGTLDNEGSIAVTMPIAPSQPFAGTNIDLTHAHILNHDGGTIEGMNLTVNVPAGATLTNTGNGSIISSRNGVAIQLRNAAHVTNTDGGLITGATNAIYIKKAGYVANGKGSVIKTVKTGGNSILVASHSDGATDQFSLTNGGIIIGSVNASAANASATILAGGSIQGNLDLGGKGGTVTLQAGAEATQLYSKAVTGMTTFTGINLKDEGPGKWILDTDVFANVSQVSIDGGGTLQVGNGKTIGSIGLKEYGDIWVNNGTLEFDLSGNLTVPAYISYATSGPSIKHLLVQAGSGVLTLDEVENLDLEIERGSTLRLSGRAEGSMIKNIVLNGSLIFGQSNNNDRTGNAINGSISGSGSVTKNGAGALILSGDNTYTGGTEINGGIVKTAEPLPGDVTLNAGATLLGTGISGLPGVLGNLTNRGTIDVGYGTSTLTGTNTTVGGNYVQTAAGTLAVSLGSELKVTGTATLAGTLEVTGKDQGYTANSHTVVLSAVKGLGGTKFSKLVKAPGVVFTSTTIGYGTDDVWLNTTDLNITAAAAGDGVSYTPASYGSAVRVQGAFDTLDTKIAKGTIDSVSSDFVRNAGAFQRSPNLRVAQASLESLSGQLHAASAGMTLQAIDATGRVLSDRLDRLTSQTANKHQVWMSRLTLGGDMARSGYANVDYQVNGWLVGTDVPLGQHALAGFAFSQGHGIEQLTERFDRNRSRNTAAMAYLAWTGSRWYVHGRVGMGHYHQHMSRMLLLGTDYQGVWTDYDGHYNVAYGESGLHLGVGSMRLTPFVDLEYDRVARSGFAEHGAGGFGLKADSNVISRWQSGVGLKLARQWHFAGGRLLGLDARVQWRQTLSASGTVFDASFVGLNAWRPLTGVGLSRHSAVFGLDLNAKPSANTRFKLDYEYLMADRGHAGVASAHFSLMF